MIQHDEVMEDDPLWDPLWKESQRLFWDVILPRAKHEGGGAVEDAFIRDESIVREIYKALVSARTGRTSTLTNSLDAVDFFAD